MGTAVCTCHCEPSSVAAATSPEWQPEAYALAAEEFAPRGLRRHHTAGISHPALVKVERLPSAKVLQQVSFLLPVVQADAPILHSTSMSSTEDCNRVLLESLRRVEPQAPFRAVSFGALKAHGRLPRSDSGLAVLFTEMPKQTKVVFLSHRWLRPWQTQAECEHNGHTWAGEPHPDDEVGTKFHLLIAGIEHVASQRGWPMSDIAVWLDFACIDQDDPFLRVAGVRSLIGYMFCCAFVVIPTLAAPSFPTVHRMPGDYGKRAWTRLEALGFYVMSLLKELKHPELYYSAPGAVQQLDYVLLPYTMPSTGHLAVQGDRDVITGHESTLLDVLHQSALHGRQAAVGPAMVASAGLGYGEKVEELLDYGVDKDTKDNNGITALWSAARQGHKGIVEMLLGRGANPDLAAKSGLAPIHCAALEGHVEVAQALLRGRANADLMDKQGQTPLLWAIQRSDTDVQKTVQLVRTLLAGGAEDVQSAKRAAEELQKAEVVAAIDEALEAMNQDRRKLSMGEGRELSRTLRERENSTVEAAVARARRLQALRRDSAYSEAADRTPSGINGSVHFPSELCRSTRSNMQALETTPRGINGTAFFTSELCRSTRG